MNPEIAELDAQLAAARTREDFSACLRVLRELVAPSPTYKALARAALDDAAKVTTVRNWLLGNSLPNEWEPLCELIGYLLNRVPGTAVQRYGVMGTFQQVYTHISEDRTQARRVRVPGAYRLLEGMRVRFVGGRPVYYDEHGSFSVREDIGAIYGGSGRYYGGCGL
ncbi:hypothetical protein [Nocardia sp. NPDC056000]|uniref:hypothetical protein n=1 Tax=Nocardia sp. NPDC056000 TaxID=3345674 RepID=UPI0035DFA3BD